LLILLICTGRDIIHLCEGALYRNNGRDDRDLRSVSSWSAPVCEKVCQLAAGLEQRAPASWVYMCPDRLQPADGVHCTPACLPSQSVNLMPAYG